MVRGEEVLRRKRRRSREACEDGPAHGEGEGGAEEREECEEGLAHGEGGGGAKESEEEVLRRARRRSREACEEGLPHGEGGRRC
uniref:Uncharacterized protein n=1 Tax=Knipowitschia caucasica TaxID=637954 RepID=A0AAV2JZD5_KNICA